MMRGWVPVPGSAKARLIEAALDAFERHGYEACAVTDVAAKAGVTTGSLYHHFGSKLGLYALVRGDLEKRVTDRMEGAAASSSAGMPAVRAALLVAFDAAATFSAWRILGEDHPSEAQDPVASMLAGLLSPMPALAAVALAAAWRSLLLAVADGQPIEAARAALELVVAG